MRADGGEQAAPPLHPHPPKRIDCKKTDSNTHCRPFF